MAIRGFLVKLKSECAQGARHHILMLRGVMNEEKKREYNKALYKANKEKILAQHAEYRKMHPDYDKTY